MALATRESPTVEGQQAAFLMSEARFPAFIAGRGAGKSVASLLKVLRYVNENPGSDLIYTVPIWHNVESILLPRLRMLYGHLQNASWRWEEKKARLVFPTLRGQCFVRPAMEGDSLRGGDYAAASMDEAGSGNQRDTFFILQAAIRQQAPPGQKPYNNQLWITTTPQVSSPWIKMIWHQRIHPLTERPLPDPSAYPVFRMRTVDNKHLPEDYRRQLMEEWAGTRMGRQELEGEFLELEGIAFPELSDIHRRSIPDGMVWVKEAVGLDPGGSDPTAIAWWKLDASRRAWLVDEYYKRNADPEDWVRWLRERGITRVVVDPSTSEDRLREWRRIYGIYFYRARPSIKGFAQRYQMWNKWLSLRDITNPYGDPALAREWNKLPSCYISVQCQNMWEELNNLAFYRPKGGDYEVDRWTPHAADHLYDAGAYALAEFESKLDIPGKMPIGEVVRR